MTVEEEDLDDLLVEAKFYQITPLIEYIEHVCLLLIYLFDQHLTLKRWWVFNNNYYLYLDFVGKKKKEREEGGIGSRFKGIWWTTLFCCCSFLGWIVEKIYLQ